MIKVQHQSILIVDDQPANLKVLSDLLQQAGFRVFVAKSGNSALDKVQEIKPLLILLDVMMPRIDGYETCRRLKAIPEIQKIPVIFISSLNEVIDKVKAFSAGGVDYITKPFQTEEVLARVQNQIALRLAKLEIETFNKQLEQLVQERTAQLETSNQSLKREIIGHQKAEEALLESETQFRLTFELAPIGMVIAALDGSFIRVNRALCNFLGYTIQELLNRTWGDIIHPEDHESFQKMHEQLSRGNILDFQLEKRYLTKDGRVLYCILQVALVKNSHESPLHLIGQCIDITDRKKAEEQLRHGALYDALTDCPNRSFLMERLDLALKRSQRSIHYLFAILFIDLDRFKVINDSLGHQIGDQLLIAVADQLKTLVRSTDIVTRLGGDEFVILLDPVTNLNEAIRVAERISQVLKRPCKLENRQVFTTASIGIALSSPDYQAGSELLRDADIAMYRAKANGKAQYQVFNQEMYTQAFNRLQLENDLHKALEQQELQVYYQPIFSLKTETIVGFEALTRWPHPQRGWISPAEFIPLAEETGLIIPLGDWVLTSACEQMSDWKSQFPVMEPLSMSINLSAKQLYKPDFIERLDQILAKTGLPCQHLQLELTESMIMEEAHSLIKLFSSLRKRQIQLSIDDFGTGYCSLSYLHRFPINILKIDRSFVSRMSKHQESHNIIETIINLAHHLNMAVIAEGVETQEQLDKLKSLDCEEAQGYFFAKPMPPNVALAWFLERQL